MHAYITVETLGATAALNATSTANISRMRQISEAVSEQIDAFTKRTFQPRVQTVEMSARGGRTLLLRHDLIALTSLKQDGNSDGTFDTTWAATDYFTMPADAEPTADYGRPFRRLEVSLRTNGAQDSFEVGQRNFQLAGTWGYSSILRTVTDNGSVDIDGTQTTLPLDATAGTTIQSGNTIKVGSEYIYVTVAGATATALTVLRGQRGTTAGSHGSGAAIQVFDYPAPIREAAFVQSSRHWKRKDSGFASDIGMVESGQLVTFKGGLDPDVRDLIRGYKRKG